MSKYKYYIGIDAGKNTGFALWDSATRRFKMIESMPIHTAILQIFNLDKVQLDNTLIIVEDARQRKWFGQNSSAKLQGAGSVKRDCTIWEDFLKELGCHFQFLPPRKGLTKMTANNFEKLTGYIHNTNEHSRDAALLVFGK